MKDFLKSFWKNQPNLTIGIGSLIILFVGFSIFSFNPEFGVSEEGIEECLDKSNRKGNRFTAKKTYTRCLKKIDQKIAQEKKDTLERKRKRDEKRKKEADKKIAERNAVRDKARLEESKQPRNIGFNDPSAVAMRRQLGLSDDIGLGA